MDAEEPSNETERCEDHSISQLMPLEDVEKMEDFDMKLAPPESSHLPSRQGGYDYNSSQELSFDSPGQSFRVNGSNEMGSPSRSQRSHNSDANSRPGDDDLADFCILFRNQDANDKERASVGTPVGGHSFLLMQNERSDVDGGGGGLDVESLDDGPFQRPQSLQADDGKTDESHEDSSTPEVDDETEASPRAPTKKEVSSQSSPSACDSTKASAQINVSPCCANPQSPAGSEPGSPSRTKSKEGSLAKVDGKQSKVRGKDLLLKVASPSLLTLTPGQETLVSPVARALACQKRVLPCGGGGSGDATSSPVISPAPDVSPVIPTPAPVPRQLSGQTAEQIDRNDVASILSKLHELSPCVSPGVSHGTTVDGNTTLAFPTTFSPRAKKLKPSVSAKVLPLSSKKSQSTGGGPPVASSPDSTDPPSHEETGKRGSQGVGDEVSSRATQKGSAVESTDATAGRQSGKSEAAYTSSQMAAKGISTAANSTDPDKAGKQTSTFVPAEVSESTQNDSGDSDQVVTDTDIAAPLPSEDRTHSEASTSETSAKRSLVAERANAEAKPKASDADDSYKSPAIMAGGDCPQNATERKETDSPLHEHEMEVASSTEHEEPDEGSFVQDHLEGSGFPQDSDDQDSSSDSDDESESGEAYLRRVNKRRRANRDLMNSIFGYPAQRSPRDAQSTREESSIDESRSPKIKPLSKTPGMLFSVNNSSDTLSSDSEECVSDIYDHLYSLYPYRDKEIELLCSLMETSIRQVNAFKYSRTIYTPAPIFVSGPSGTGKTSVVLDILKTLKKVNKTRESPWKSQDNASTIPLIGSAYVNCATVAPGSIDTIVESAFGQLVEDVRSPEAQSVRRREKQKSKIPRRRKRPRSEIGSDMHDSDTDSEGDMEDMIEAERTRSTKGVELASKGLERKAKTVSLRSRGVVGGERQVDGATRKVKERTSLHAVPMAFGRALLPFFRTDAPLTEPRGCGFLVLDNGDALLSLSSSASERNNFLSQLLITPKILGLNLTVIVITRSILLNSSRFNNAVPPSRGVGTIKQAIGPIPVHFSAYRGKKVFKAILKQPKLKQLIIGLPDPEKGTKNPEFQERVYDSFLDVLTDSLLSSTRDIRDIIRIGRLWPTYIAPLQSSRIQATLETIRSKDQSGCAGSSSSDEHMDSSEIKKKLLTFLDQMILPRLRIHLESGSFFVKNAAPVSHRGGIQMDESPVGDLPYLSKCLVLAAFICQANKPEKDHQLLTIQKRGTRSKRKRGEVDAGRVGSSAREEQQQNLLRPRTFALERMLSVFVNMTGLLQGTSNLFLRDPDAGLEGLLRSMGNDVFFESISQLRELGYLREGGTGSNGNRKIDLSSTKYWCPLTIDEAEEMAKSIDFPMDRFLI